MSESRRPSLLRCLAVTLQTAPAYAEAQGLGACKRRKGNDGKPQRARCKQSSQEAALELSLPPITSLSLGFLWYSNLPTLLPREGGRLPSSIISGPHATECEGACVFSFMYTSHASHVLYTLSVWSLVWWPHAWSSLVIVIKRTEARAIEITSVYEYSRLTRSSGEAELTPRY